MHQASDGEMRHHQAIELLSYQVGGLTAQHYFGTTQMGLEFVQRCLYFPSLMIQRRQFRSWRLFVVKDCGEQAIDRLRPLDPIQPVLYDSNDNSIFFVPLVCPGAVYPLR